MKTLYLLRHGKSQPFDPGIDDFERSLTERGVRDTELIAQWMKQHGDLPTAIFCSSATRTMETYAQWAEIIRKRPLVCYDEALYLARSTLLLTIVQGIDDKFESAMLVGHNPGMHELACLLAGNKKEAKVRDLQAKFPTCALAVLEFDVESWGLVDAATGILKDFVTPRRLRN